MGGRGLHGGGGGEGAALHGGGGGCTARGRGHRAAMGSLGLTGGLDGSAAVPPPL